MNKEIIHNLVNQYNRENRLPEVKLIDKANLPIEVSAKIAKAFLDTPEDLQDKEVKQAYRAFKRELINQFRLLSKVIKFEFTTDNPYENSKAMFEDININGRLKVFTGGEYHPVMQGINKIFRAVHDCFGHYVNFNSFSFEGEYNAYLHHKQTFSPLAQKALFTETIAQNSYYRVHKQFSEQKTIIIEEGIRILC